MSFPVKTAQWQRPLHGAGGRKDWKFENFLQWTCKPKARSLMMGCPPGATAQRQQVYSRTCMTLPTRAQEHPALPRSAPKRGRVGHAWQGSLLIIDIINRSFVLRQGLSPYSFQLQTAAKCSCPQHCRPSCRDLSHYWKQPQKATV